MNSNIQVETYKDHIINTTPALKIDMSNIEIASDSPHNKPRIEIPERRRMHDSDSSDDANDYTFLVNQKKFAPRDVSDTLEKAECEKIENNADNRSRSSKNSKASRTSKASRRSRRSRRSNDDNENTEYKRRYSIARSRSHSPAKSQRDYSSGKDFIKSYSSDPKNSETAFMSQSKNFPEMSGFLNSSIFGKKSTSAMTDDEIRFEKSYRLQQYETKNRDFIYSSKRLSMNNSLEEIWNELEYVTRKRDMENNMTVWKQGLLVFVDSLTALNTTYDPFDVELTDWAKEMHWNVMRLGRYDEVLEELIEKWRGKIPMSPELKLLFLMGSSLAFGVMTKKNEKAAMQKRMEEQRQMKEQIRQSVRAEIAKQNMSTNPKTYPSAEIDRNIPSNNLHFKGPSMTDADIIKMMEERFVDTTEADDSSVASSISTTTNKNIDEKSIQSTATKRAEATENTENVITVPANSISVRGTGSRRARGRPRKAYANENVVTVDM